MIINSKWHRTSFVPSFLIADKEIELLISAFIDTFKQVSKNFSNNSKQTLRNISKSMGGIRVGK